MPITYDEIVALHKKYAPSDVVYDLIFTHCCIVRDIALQLVDTNNLAVGRTLVETWCALYNAWDRGGAYSQGRRLTRKSLALCGTSYRSWSVQTRYYQSASTFACGRLLRRNGRGTACYVG